MKQLAVLGMDIGGTKIRSLVMNSTQKCLLQSTTPTIIRTHPRDFLDQIESIIRDARIRFPQIRAVGLACAGPLHPEKGLLLNPINLQPQGKASRAWKRVELVKTLSDRLKLPIILENDAAAATLGEFYGKPRIKNGDHRTLALLTLGTGLGVGILQSGQLLKTSDGGHPELGHWIVATSIPPDSPPTCRCGNAGCAEGLLAGSHFAQSYLNRFQRLAQLDGRALSAEGRSGNPTVLRAFERYATHLSTFFYNLTLTYQPAVIALAGGFSSSAPSFLRSAIHQYRCKLKAFDPCLFPPAQIRLAKLGADAGAIGGAYAALLFTQPSGSRKS